MLMYFDRQLTVDARSKILGLMMLVFEKCSVRDFVLNVT